MTTPRCDALEAAQAKHGEWARGDHEWEWQQFARALEAELIMTTSALEGYKEEAKSLEELIRELPST